jgi:hypothetical protein
MSSATLTSQRRDGAPTTGVSTPQWASAVPSQREAFETHAVKAMPFEPLNRRPCGRYASARVEEAWGLWGFATGGRS